MEEKYDLPFLSDSSEEGSTKSEIEKYDTDSSLSSDSETDSEDEVIHKSKIMSMADKFRTTARTKQPINYTKEEKEYAKRPMGKAILKSVVEEFPERLPEKKEGTKAKPNDRLECDVCGKFYFRSGRTRHQRTKHHQVMASANKIIRDTLINSIK